MFFIKIQLNRKNFLLKEDKDKKISKNTLYPTYLKSKFNKSNRYYQVLLILYYVNKKNVSPYCSKLLLQTQPNQLCELIFLFSSVLINPPSLRTFRLHEIPSKLLRNFVIFVPDPQVKSRAIRLYPGCPSSPIPHSHLDHFFQVCALYQFCMVHNDMKK